MAPAVALISISLKLTAMIKSAAKTRRPTRIAAVAHPAPFVSVVMVLSPRFESRSPLVCRPGRPWMTDRIINSPARRSPVLEAVLNAAHRSYVNLAPASHPSTGRIGASLVVKKQLLADCGHLRRCG